MGGWDVVNQKEEELRQQRRVVALLIDGIDSRDKKIREIERALAERVQTDPQPPAFQVSTACSDPRPEVRILLEAGGSLSLPDLVEFVAMALRYPLRP